MKKQYLLTFTLIFVLSLTACAMPGIKVDPPAPPQQQGEAVTADTVAGATTVSPEFYNNYHPIIFAFPDEKGTFSTAKILGGSKGAQWVKIDDLDIKGKYIKPEDFMKSEPVTGNYADTDLAQGGETYRLYSTGSHVVRMSGQKPTLDIPPSCGEKILTVELKPFKLDAELLIGVNGNWDPRPRIPRAFSEANTWSIDVDGDGDFEILHTQESKANQGSNVDVVLEKDGKTVQIEKIALDGTYTAKYRVILLDLNGDGRLELLTVQWGHNTSVHAYEFRDGQASKVLSYYYGD